MTNQPIQTSSTAPDATPAQQLSLATQLGSMLGAQSWHWRSGQPVAVEDIANGQLQSLSHDQQMSLICNEVYLRERAGQAPELAEYQARYPHLAAELAIQWEIDHWLVPIGANIDTPKASAPKTWSELPKALSKLGDERFTIQSLIGSGGMGVVYLAVDNRLKRVVALKRLTDRAAQDAGARARFAREAELIAQLNNTHVVPIFETGEEAGVPYIAMEYCAGGSLHDWLRSGPLEAKIAAEVVRQIAVAIAAAHGLSVVHRDLKPGNILSVAPFDATRSLHLKVSDFGVARRIDAPEHFTQTGEILGTPSYMAPEQARGGAAAQHPAVDIYALGAILYECLTGRPPFHGATPLDTLRLLTTQEIVPIDRLQPNVPPDLAAIAHKCLQADPQYRYRSAADVGDDLQRFLNGKPTVARPAGWPIKAWKWIRRHPALTAGVSLTTAAALLMLAVWISFTEQLKFEKDRALAESVIAKEQSQRAQRNSAWAMEAVDTLVTQVGDKQLSQIPGMSETRKKLLQAAVDFCEKFFEDRDSQDPDAMNDVALAHRRLAKIYRSLGDKDEWMRQLQSATAIHRQLVEQHANQPKYLIELAKTLNNLSNVEGEILGPGPAAVTSEEAIRIKEQLVKLEPTSVEYRSSLALSLSGIGPKLRISDPRKTEAYYGRSVEILRSLVTDQPHQLDVQRSLAIAHRNWAVLANTQGRFADASEQARQCVQILRRLCELQPGPTTTGELMGGLDLLAACYASELKLKEAMELNREALDGLRKITQEFPENFEYQAAYFDSVINMANLHRQLQEFNEASATALEVLDAFDLDSQATQANLRHIASLKALLGLIYYENAQFDRSIETIAQSNDLLKKCNPEVVSAFGFLQNEFVSVATGLCKKQSSQAQESLQKHWPEVCKLAASQPQQIEPARLMLRWSATLMLIHLRAGDVQRAEQVLQSAQNCHCANVTTQLALLAAVLQAAHGRYTEALDAVDQLGGLRVVSDLWPDHIPSFIVETCKKQAESDSAMNESQRLAMVQRCQQLLPVLQQHALTIGWNIPARQRH